MYVYIYISYMYLFCIRGIIKKTMLQVDTKILTTSMTPSEEMLYTSSCINPPQKPFHFSSFQAAWAYWDHVHHA